MAKAATINVNDIFAPPHPQGASSANSYGEPLPTLANSAGPGPSSLGAAANRLSGQVLAVSSEKEKAANRNAISGRRSGGPSSAALQPNLLQFNDGRPHGQPSARLPPLPQGYGPGSFSSTSQQPPGAGTATSSSPQPPEPLQPLIQHPAMLPGPTPASHPYHPKRKPPSAFMRNNHLRHFDVHLHHPHHQSAGPSRSYGSFDPTYATQFASDQQQQYAEAVVAAAAEAMAQSDWGDGGGGGGGGGAAGTFPGGPPWGVSSVSDLEALDSILDQLVVVDARMRKALLKGPLISFETVVPEHILNGGMMQPMQHQRGGGGGAAGAAPAAGAEEDKDRIFITAVKGIAEEGEEEEQPQAAATATATSSPRPPADAVSATATASIQPTPRPVSDMLPAAHQDVAIAEAAAAGAAASSLGAAGGEGGDPLETAMFRPAIPNTTLHPTFTRAYLASKLAAKAQLLPPPPPATAEHLLRSRPPAFIAAPSYDQLCSQIRDVQRQYTCGTSRPSNSGAGTAAAAAVAAGPNVGAIVASAPPTASALMANLLSGGTNSQYISGLDGPTLEEVVAHQDLPICLERVRPTFVALKTKAGRAPSPKRRGSPGGTRTLGGGGDGADEAGSRGLSGRRL
ncbi:hypothetical protein Agub_g428 [Astrephomene gubernaculifera]|uniref:Uncharacterized protein n=1 Tax=Astrephomene gubernaculifera TaxID=47775 RepID=A0AAD3HGV9_9CHLO|nr:hypothetical protein Agub_g428 [Astrephomene gubernaculifera]